MRLPLPQRPRQLQVCVLKILKGIVSRVGFTCGLLSQSSIYYMADDFPTFYEVTVVIYVFVNFLLPTWKLF